MIAPYYHSARVTLYNADCFDVMPGMADNSVDSVVCDPPYELGFMGKSWDNTGIAYDVDMWREVLRVLKPGGHLLAFGGSRTYHRLACAIEDAGFEIRDMIEWMYGCLSEDTEILTKNGWERYHIAIDNSLVYAYNIETEEFEFQKPIRSYIYENKHTAYRIQSDYTDQIVSRNHRCIVERSGKFTFQRAETLQQQENIPFLESLRDLPKAISGIYEGTSIKQSIVENGSSSPYKSQPARQSNREFNAIREQPQAQVIRRTRATVTPIEYTGKVWCVQVPAGAFVARRNGKIFITGNSGFPKSLNISKAIDKAAGAEREVMGIAGKSGSKRSSMSGDFKGGEYDETAPATLEAVQWEGWGSNLKPAHEPICLARKPLSERTIAKNVLAHGTGGINIDGCRVETNGETPTGSGNPCKNAAKEAMQPGRSGGNGGNVTPPSGRFPANLIHDGSDEVLAAFPETKQIDKRKQKIGRSDRATEQLIGLGVTNTPAYGDSGSAARFFYQAKASKRDRNEGCESLCWLDEKQIAESLYIELAAENEANKKVEGYKRHKIATGNIHSTVKPEALMRYLCRLITPPGGIVFDGFMGSGSTGKAAALEGFRFIGIDNEIEHCEIAKARIHAAELMAEADLFKPKG